VLVTQFAARQFVLTSAALLMFTNSVRMDYRRTHYGTGYYIYDRYDHFYQIDERK